MADYKHDFLIGNGVTYAFNGDRHPATVIHVTPNKVVVQEDSYQVKAGEGYPREGSVPAEFYPNPEGRILEFHYAPSKGKMMSKGGGPFVLVHGRSYGRNPHL